MTTLPPPSGRAERPSAPDPDVLSFLSTLNLLLRSRYLVVGVACLLTALVAVVLLLWPATYTAESAFTLQSRPSLPANLSGLASQFGLSLGSEEPNQSPAFYAELLQSREILNAVVDTPLTLTVGEISKQAMLADWLRVRGRSPALRREKTIEKLGSCVDVSLSTKTGVVTLKVTTRNRELSVRISDIMLSWINEFNLEKRQSQASQERKFIEGRVQEARQELSDAEDRLLQFTQRNRDTRNSPLLSLEQDRLSREVAMDQQVYTSIVQAYDRAKIEEVRDTPVITVLLEPEAPVRADPRHLVLKGALAFALGLLLGVWLALGRDALSPRSLDGASARAELEALRGAVLDDLRHPLRTAGRLLRLSGGGAS